MPKLEISNPRLVPRPLHVTMRSRVWEPRSSCSLAWSVDWWHQCALQVAEKNVESQPCLRPPASRSTSVSSQACTLKTKKFWASGPMCLFSPEFSGSNSPFGLLLNLSSDMWCESRGEGRGAVMCMAVSAGLDVQCPLSPFVCKWGAWFGVKRLLSRCALGLSRQGKK